VSGGDLHVSQVPPGIEHRCDESVPKTCGVQSGHPHPRRLGEASRASGGRVPAHPGSAVVLLPRIGDIGAARSEHPRPQRTRRGNQCEVVCGCSSRGRRSVGPRAAAGPTPRSATQGNPRAAQVLDGGGLQDAVDDTGAVEPGHHRRAPRHRRGLETAGLSASAARKVQAAAGSPPAGPARARRTSPGSRAGSEAVCCRDNVQRVRLPPQRSAAVDPRGISPVDAGTRTVVMTDDLTSWRPLYRRSHQRPPCGAAESGERSRLRRRMTSHGMPRPPTRGTECDPGRARRPAQLTWPTEAAADVQHPGAFMAAECSMDP